MEKPPRDPDEPILDQSHWIAIGLHGLVFTGAVLGGMFIALYGMGMSEPEAVTVTFLTLALSQLWHIFNMRDYGTGLLSNDITRNPYVWGALGLCVGLIVAVVYVPLFASVLKVRPLGLSGWGLVLSMSLVPLVYGQVVKALNLHCFESSSKE